MPIFTQVGPTTLGLKGAAEGREQGLPSLGPGKPTAVTRGWPCAPSSNAKGWVWADVVGQGLAASDIQSQVGSSVGVLSNLSLHGRTLWFKVKVNFCGKASHCSFAKSAI